MTVQIYDHDIPSWKASTIYKWNYLSIDTETTGLDVFRDKLKLVQLCNGNQVVIVRDPDWDSRKLKECFLYSSLKIFHNALFDIKFLSLHTGIKHWFNTQCTKTLMKILYPAMSSGLSSSLREILGIYIQKDENIQSSDWGNELSKEQIEYACNDVLYLYNLYQNLFFSLSETQEEIYYRTRLALVDKAFIEVRGYTDLLDYEKEDITEVLFRRNQWMKISKESF